MRRNRWLALFMALFILYNGAVGAAETGGQLADTAELPQIEAGGAVLIDRASGRMLYGLREDAMLPMASTTKIMTALLALEQCELTELVTASEDAHGVPGTSIYLEVGEQLTMEQMLEGLLLASANDAAVAIAQHVDGSVEAFARRMNARARELGADARFVTPNGLDAEGHAASALGMARIAAQALVHDEFRRIVITERATIPWANHEYLRALHNKNKLLTMVDGATGVKTGFTKKAGRCLIFSAERGGMELVGAVLNCGNWFESGAQLLEWGFERYRPVVALEAGIQAAELLVSDGDCAAVGVAAPVQLTVPVAASDQWTVHLDLPERLTAPVPEGAVVGRAWVEMNGEELCEVPLLVMTPVETWGMVPALKRVASFWPACGRLK